VAPDRLGERREARVIAGAAQIFDRRLREILVAVADLRRHVHVFDVGRAPKCGEHSGDEVAETLTLASAAAIDAVDLRRVDEPGHSRDRVVDMDEVTPLLAVANSGTVRLE